MGRVARYKKVKSFDPYSKANGGNIQLENVGIWGLGQDGRKPKKRSRTSEKLRALRKKTTELPEFDAPPTDKDDFDMSDLVGSLKKQKRDQDTAIGEASDQPRISTTTIPVPTNSKRTQTTASNEDTHDDAKMNKFLKIEEKLKSDGSNQTKMNRMEGESKAAYRRRVRVETRQLIHKERMSTLNQEKRKKKKEFLNQKKKRRRMVECSDDEEPVTTATAKRSGSQSLAARELSTRVHFGEQAERPPSFEQLPRGAKKKAPKKSRNSGMGEGDVAAERAAMEIMRRKVQAQYAAIKQQRKNRGDFHL